MARRGRRRAQAVDRVGRPVALFVMPATRGDGWQLTPVLSLDAIRLFVSLGGRLERDLRSALLPAAAASELIERTNVNTLHAGPKECLDSAGQLAQELTRELGTPVGPGVPKEKRDRWGRLLVTRRSYRGNGGEEVPSWSCALSPSPPGNSASGDSARCGVMTATVSRAQ